MAAVETNQVPATNGDAKAATPAIVVPPGHKLASYFFKTEKLKDEEGKPIGDGPKHPDVKVTVPMPSIQEVIDFLASQDGTKEAKVRDLIMDSLWDTIFLAGRSQINEWRDAEANKGKNFTPDQMDLSKLSLQAIAEMPKGQRGAWAPGEEEFKDFNELYTNVLVHKTGYDPKKTKTHTDHWKAGMAKVKTNKPVLNKLNEFLILFAANCTEEELQEVEQTYNWLTARAAKYIKAEEKNFLEAL